MSPSFANLFCIVDKRMSCNLYIHWAIWRAKSCLLKFDNCQSSKTPHSPHPSAQWVLLVFWVFGVIPTWVSTEFPLLFSWNPVSFMPGSFTDLTPYYRPQSFWYPPSLRSRETESPRHNDIYVNSFSVSVAIHWLEGSGSVRGKNPPIKEWLIYWRNQRLKWGITF